MPAIPGLRSPYARVGPLVYFGRMLDKIRLRAAGRLPAEYAANLGEHRPGLFDARCCRFLGVPYAELVDRVRAGGTDEEILAWANSRGLARTDEDCAVWNSHMTRVGWRDDLTARLQQRIREYACENRGIETMFDLIEADEGREPPQVGG